MKCNVFRYTYRHKKRLRSGEMGEDMQAVPVALGVTVGESTECSTYSDLFKVGSPVLWFRYIKFGCRG